MRVSSSCHWQKWSLVLPTSDKNLILRPGSLLMLGTEQTKQGVKHRKILDFRQEHKKDRWRQEEIVELSQNGALTHQHPMDDQVWESTMKSKLWGRNNQLLPNKNGNTKESAKWIFKNWSRVAGLSLRVVATHTSNSQALFHKGVNIRLPPLL